MDSVTKETLLLMIFPLPLIVLQMELGQSSQLRRQSVEQPNLHASLQEDVFLFRGVATRGKIARIIQMKTAQFVMVCVLILHLFATCSISFIAI